MSRPVTGRGPSESMSSPVGSDRPGSPSPLVSRANSRSRKPIVLEDIGELTEEEKLRSMLGYVDQSQKNVYMREDFCGACGIQHPNYRVLDTYPLCESCHNCLRDQADLRNRFQGTVQSVPLEICFATYGDVNNSRLAYEVTDTLQGIVNDYACKDRLILREIQKLHLMFNGDPSPDKPKQLRVRYRMNGVHGMITIDVMANNQVPEPIMLMCSPTRDLTILRGAYGHPKGRTSTGRMSYDVRENLQGLVDLNYGSYLYISAMMPISLKFGDPCIGYVKDLQIEFDISGKFGRIEIGENRGYLKKDLSLRTSPAVSPLIYVAHATYGLTENGIKERIQELNRWLHQIEILVNKRKIGLPIKVKDRQFIKKEPDFKAERDQLLQAEPSSIDITVKVQRMVEMQGGLELVIDKDEFDANFTFGNPCKGRKMLEISVKCYGHDSEIRTDSREVTAKGFQKNFILGKAHRFLVPVLDDKEGRGILQSTIEFRTNNVLPLMNIERAMYGHPRDHRKCFDVTSTIQNLVKGRMLVIRRSENLLKLFGEPCHGVSKVLRVDYSTRGFTGALRVREKNDCLVAAVELGFPPEIPEDV